MSDQFRVESTRGGRVESVHRVSVAVVDRDGRLVASAGDPALVTFWRSAAKPFQAAAMVADGAADRFGFESRDLALACASHSSEPVHLETAAAMLKKLGQPESALACGPHQPLSAVVAEQVIRHDIAMSPRWSNCSGKHASMIALALNNGWPVAGYASTGHPVQARILSEVERWTDTAARDIALGVDGCTTVCFGLPLAAMALAYGRLAVTAEPSAQRLRDAMTLHPDLIAGEDRLETDLGRAVPGKAIAKVGADGIFCALLPEPGLGIALKVEDGDMRSSSPALLAVLRAIAERSAIGFDPDTLPPTVTRHAELPTVNTRGITTGVLRPAGGLGFRD